MAEMVKVTDLDGYAVVAGHWPLAGPYNVVRTVYAANALSALVAYLGRAGVTADGLASRADADRVTTSIREALADLPAVLSAIETHRAAFAER